MSAAGDDPDSDHDGRLASPPCYALELDPGYFGAEALPDLQQQRDVARWRRAERTRLLTERRALGVGARRQAAVLVAGYLDRLLVALAGGIAGLTIAAWWPIKAELNLLFWLEGLAARGATAALPLMTEPTMPMSFRPWTARTAMTGGIWNIPVPAGGPMVRPDIVLAPVVGFDTAGYRLGYGGGYFDRTLASLKPRPWAIGVGLAAARIRTIYPQPHDVPMHAVVTENGIAVGGDPVA
jgi:5-formyltetrahydrofolate cyclo-ligase